MFRSGMEPRPARTKKNQQKGTAMEEKNETTMRQLGRADYEERREARIERLKGRAAAHAKASYEESRKAHRAVERIPFGQPNIRGALTGAIKRSQAATERSIREAEVAERAAEAAEAAERNTAISSDDPNALDKLRKKLAVMERTRERIKEANKLCRGKDRAAAEAKLREMGVEEESLAEMLDGRLKGFPSYVLSNLTANIGRVQKRIEAMERLASTPLPEGWEFEGGKVVVNAEINRLQIVFKTRQDEATTARLKRNGFKWSRWEMAWQRMLTPAAVGCARAMFPKVEGGAE